MRRMKRDMSHMRPFFQRLWRQKQNQGATEKQLLPQSPLPPGEGRVRATKTGKLFFGRPQSQFRRSLRKTAAYKIQRRERPSGPWTDASMAIESEITLSDQTRGTEWEFRVIAVNKAGEGLSSNTVMAVL